MRRWPPKGEFEDERFSAVIREAPRRRRTPFTRRCRKVYRTTRCAARSASGARRALMVEASFTRSISAKWLRGDPGNPPPPATRLHGRNWDWGHPQQFPKSSRCRTSGNTRGTPPGIWAFHCVTLALIDPEFAGDQLVLLTREWYMHPNGQLPAYEWAFGDVNPPVHAWAAWRVYENRSRKAHGVDMATARVRLERVFLTS